MMLQIRKEPLRELRTLQRELDDMFTRVFGRHERWLPALLREEEHFPAIDFVRKNDTLVIRAELPGIDPKDVDISVTGNQLRIRGEKKAEQKYGDEDYFMHEIGLGEFERTMTLPEGVNTEEIHASYVKGILEITMPAKEVPKPKRIEILPGKEA